MRGLSLVAASGGHSSSRCAVLSLSRPLLLQSTGSRRAGSVVVAHGPIRSAACGIFPDQGSNPCPLHWQADSQPLRHQGSPDPLFLFFIFNLKLSSFWVKVKLPNLYMWQLHDVVNQGGGSRLCGVVMGIACCLFWPDVAFCATNIPSVKLLESFTHCSLPC